jgi:8-amino-7-oxononanoate synthase
VIRFSSALYLGFHHGSHTLPAWEHLTTGMPAAMEESPLCAGVEAGLCDLMGCGGAAVAPSTLQAFWDVFEMLAHDDVDILVDGGTYAVARWGVEHAACRGARAEEFRTHDAEALRRLVWDRRGRNHRRVAVVADGVDALKGRLTPLGAYLDIAEAAGGVLIVDDTQALGLLGRRKPGSPFGVGGGRLHSMAWAGGRRVVSVASLAKGFGAPIAIVGGDARYIERFKSASRTRVYCSPPSAAAIASAHRALDLNAQRGDVLRDRLAENVRRFRTLLRRRGLAATGGLFPVQTLTPTASGLGADASDLRDHLAAAGIEAVLRSTEDGPRVSFLINALHTTAQLERSADVLAKAVSADAVLAESSGGDTWPRS